MSQNYPRSEYLQYAEYKTVFNVLYEYSRQLFAGLTCVILEPLIEYIGTVEAYPRENSHDKVKLVKSVVLYVYQANEHDNGQNDNQ